jgi:PKD repeat protein
MNVTGIKKLSASPVTCNFGEVLVNSPASLDVTLNNSGSDSTTVNSININNSVFTHDANLPLIVDGFGSTGFTVTFEPNSVGYESGTMTITSDANDNPSLTVNLNGEGKNIIAAFSAAPRSGSVPLEVNFTDLSAGSVTGWSWSFGDSATSTVQDPNHIYNSSGYYTVGLTVSGPSGSDTETKTDYIYVE